ncbi:MAG: nitroreductase family protein, partial [Halobacteriales archaeon]
TLDAGRLAPSGKNLQHWRFVLLDDSDDVERLADLSTTGGWVEDADFAVVVLTDPTYGYHQIDAGRAITHMQFRAWVDGVGSCIYTGYDESDLRAFLGAPDTLDVTAVVGFGYPADGGAGTKGRAPLGEVAFDGRFGESFER